MACLRYPLRFPVLFIRMLHLTEVVERTAQTSINHLSMSVLICFQICGKIGTLAGNISKGGFTCEEVLVLAGKVRVGDYCGVRENWKIIGNLICTKKIKWNVSICHKT